ncbi:MAG TPA: hypothetical protein VNE38_07125 [Ktedonobacteraceae bacterium]|nr:hypothetical protein [Ktedonobacteraceae bacterium]
MAIRREAPVPQPQYIQHTQPVAQQNQQPPVAPLSYASQDVAAKPGSMQSVGPQPGSAPRRRRRWPWPLKVLTILLIVAILLVGGWFLAARPILRSVAENQFNQVVSSNVDLILPVPVITTLAITETAMNNLIALNHAPSDPVQNAVVHISPPLIASDGSYTGGVQFDFQIYGFSCSLTTIPVVSNGQIVVTHVQVQGIISWILSADDMTALLNAQLQNAVARMHRQVLALTLKPQEIDIQLGSTVL